MCNTFKFEHIVNENYLYYLQILLIIQLFSGLTALNVYAVKIFNEVFDSQAFSEIIQNNSSVFDCSSLFENSTSTFVTSSEAYISGITITFVRLASSLLLSVLLTKLRRRVMFMTSALLTTIFLVCFATLNFFIESGNVEGKLMIKKYAEWNQLNLENLFYICLIFSVMSALQWTSMATACLLVFSAQLGVQSLPYLLTGELFPSGGYLARKFIRVEKNECNSQLFHFHL